MLIFKIFLILLVTLPAVFLMARTAADVRRDLVRHKRKARGQEPGQRRLRAVK